MIYFVSTPIGNLEDITLRAISTLKSVDVIACEDTRTSLPLLNKYEINKKLISYHKFNEKEASQKIVELNNEGKNIAIISDAGMPGISDPGYILSKQLNEQNIPFTVLPGANAALTALVYSGLSTSQFYFVGFLPEKNTDKQKIISQILALKASLIFYISAHNIKKDLKFLHEALGARKACLVKELTKLHENKFNFTLGDELEINEKGEFVLIVEGSENNFDEMSVIDHVKFYINIGLTKNDAIKKVASERNLNKNEVYKQVLNLKA
ncbi:MAG: 16S rRNA (cytidine(1402)-2'-O)-methyltransferase [Clostridia bacterium]|nr:16S rRNA (cytidine(1402)-2'-O)-methyltransferase [Clostridia bacterium]